MTHQTTVKEETVAMMVANMTTAAGTTATIAAITTVAGLIQMAITISAITSMDAICMLASTREPTIERPTKVIAVWNMTLPTARRV